jgi:glycosyltransferase involved in cell wall biosynthesis
LAVKAQESVDLTMNIALLGKYFGWGGGAEFLRNVALGLLTKQKEHTLRLYLLLPMHRLDIIRVVKRSVISTVKSKRPTLVLTKPDFYHSFLDCFEDLGGAVEIVYYDNSDRDLLRCMKKLGIDVILPVFGSLGVGYPLPWIGYMADLQHKYYPDNFTDEDSRNRDLLFTTILREAPTVIVNSVTVKNDISRFYPDETATVFALPFAPLPLAAWFDDPECSVTAKYGLPDGYFLISNQFWIHKDHLTAFEALLSVPDAHLVCTGLMTDYNHPDHVDSLKSFLRDTNLEERVQLLGHIPKREQIEIMKHAQAVVQPTLFEGGPGGGSVYDAACLGVPVILSDIAVNREVEGDNLFFFEAGNSSDLARKMKTVLGMDVMPPSQETLLSRGQKRAECLGDELMTAIDFTLKACPGGSKK